jgi:hypothetical protein
MENFGIIVTCSKHDYLYAKGTCASIRHFMKDIPLCLLVDGDFNLGALPQIYNAAVITQRTIKDPFLKMHSWGWGLTKMNAFWESPFERFLLIDADTVVYGDVSIYADFDNYDFIIDQPKYSYSPEAINMFFFDPSKIKEYDPDFDHIDNLYVCTGVIFGKRDVLNLDDYKHFLTTIQKDPTIFRCGEQGFLNYTFYLSQQKGILRLKNTDIQFITRDYSIDTARTRFPIPPPDQINQPTVIHWASETKPSRIFSDHVYVDPMTFFRKKYLHDIHITDERKIEKILAKEEYKREFTKKTLSRKILATLFGDRFIQSVKRVLKISWGT